MNLENEVVERCRTRVGRSLGQSWRLDALIGIGALGAVYAGSHRNGLVAAVKLLHPAIAAHADAKALFPRDVVAANRARHPSTVAVLGDESDPQTGPFLILELLIGETVESRARALGGKLPLGEALALVEPLLAALESAHRAGVVHRDIRPRKLFLASKGGMKLLDLGMGVLRELCEPRARVSRDRAAFMAPEQALGRSSEIESRTDIWAAGATLFSLLTGVPVHEGETASELLINAATRAPRSIGRLRPDLPRPVIRFVDCALEREKHRRFASAAAMRAELARLRELLGPLSNRSEAVSGPPPTRRSISEAQRGTASEPSSRASGENPPRLRTATSTLRPSASSSTEVPAMATPRVPRFDASSRARSVEPPPTRPLPSMPASRSASEEGASPTLAPPAATPARTEPPSARLPSAKASDPAHEVPTLVPSAPLSVSEEEPSSTRGWVPEPPSTRGWIPQVPEARARAPGEPAPSSRGARATALPSPPLPSATDAPPSSRAPNRLPPSSRRVLDGASSARAGQESFFATKELFAQLQGIFTGSTQHGPKHPEVVRYIERTFQMVRAALQRFPKGLVFQVTPSAFEAAGRASWEPLPPHDDLPFRLFASGVRGLGLLPGLKEIELGSLLRILTLDPARSSGPEDDLASLLWEADLPHVAIHRVDVLLEGSAEAAISLERERRALLDEQGLSAEALLRGPRRPKLPLSRSKVILDALGLEASGKDEVALLALDERVRGAAVAELERGAPALTDRFAVAAALGYRGSVRRGSPESVAEPLRASVSSIASNAPISALQLVARLCAAVDDPPPPEHERLGAAFAPSILAPEALRTILAGLTAAPDRVDALRRLAAVFELLDAAHFFAAFEALITTSDDDLRGVLLPFIARVAAGHEAAIGPNVPRVGELLGVELTRILGGLDSVAAREALSNATRSPYARVRIEALCHAEGLDGDKLGVALDGLLGDPEDGIRTAALDAIARHRVTSAEGPLVARIGRSDFDSFPIDERRRTLLALAAVAPSRAESVLVGILGHSRLMAPPAHEQSRELAARLLGELASSKEALLALTAASKKRWGNSEAVRVASLESIERVCARAAQHKEPSKTP